ncbi:MAG: hypothetical protein MJZ61_07055 [Bacteroidales bacterium]|nr:hypothetical protein [Bacteroidales bacterium]
MGYRSICRKVKQLKRTKTFHNLQSADTVGVLFDSTQQSSYQAARAFVNSLVEKGKKVMALGMVLNQEMLNYYVQQDCFSFFSLEKTTFLCYPDSPAVEQFVSRDFDLLVNVSTVENLSVDYVMALSKAKCKISPVLSNNDFADFLFQFNNLASLETATLIERIKEYLSMISRG